MHAPKQMMGRQLSPHTDPRNIHRRWAEASHSIHIFLLIPSAGIDLGYIQRCYGLLRTILGMQMNILKVQSCVDTAHLAFLLPGEFPHPELVHR